MAIEEFTSNGARDFRQRYQNTYGYFTADNNKKILVYMSDVNEQYTSFVDADAVTYRAMADKGVCFEFIPVEKRLFIHNGRLMLAARRPARQWQRGITSANTSFMDVTYNGGFEVDFSTVSAYEKQNYANTIEQHKPVLLNKMLGINNNGTVFLYDRVIGKMKEGNITITNHAFYQEVTDTLRARNISISVEKE